MRLPITLTTAALAIAFAAGPAQAGAAPSTGHQGSTKGAVVLIGANDYGLVAPVPFTPPIGTDKGSATAATPTTAPTPSNGIIAILIG
jgi:hypothetical protein